MTVVTFDAFATARSLRAAGATEEMASAIATALNEAARLPDASELATRNDLKTLENALRGELKTVESTLRGELKTVGSTLRGDLQALEIATRNDLKTVESSLRSDLKMLESTLNATIARANADTIKWTVGIIGFQALAVIGSLFAILRALQPHAA